MDDFDDIESNAIAAILELHQALTVFKNPIEQQPFIDLIDIYVKDIMPRPIINPTHFQEGLN
jgi:hypothetical protein